MSNKIEDLDPEFRKRLMDFIAKMAAEGIPVAVVSTLRTLEEQQAQWFKGRDKTGKVIDPKAVVTQCDGIIKRSKHQDGLAADVTFAYANGKPYWPDEDTVDGSTRWLAWAMIVESCNLVSGARFTPLNQYGVGWDPDHVEMPA